MTAPGGPLDGSGGGIGGGSSARAVPWTAITATAHTTHPVRTVVVITTPPRSESLSSPRAFRLEFAPSVTTLPARMAAEPPSKAEILKEIQQWMKELFELDAERVQPEARLIEDLELDSLDAFDLAVKVEEATGLAFDES